jgi:hypothetical protein
MAYGNAPRTQAEWDANRKKVKEEAAKVVADNAKKAEAAKKRFQSRNKTEGILPDPFYVDPELAKELESEEGHKDEAKGTEPKTPETPETPQTPPPANPGDPNAGQAPQE